MSTCLREIHVSMNITNARLSIRIVSLFIRNSVWACRKANSFCNWNSYNRNPLILFIYDFSLKILIRTSEFSQWNFFGQQLKFYANKRNSTLLCFEYLYIFLDYVYQHVLYYVLQLWISSKCINILSLLITVSIGKSKYEKFFFQ